MLTGIGMINPKTGKPIAIQCGSDNLGPSSPYQVATGGNWCFDSIEDWQNYGQLPEYQSAGGSVAPPAAQTMAITAANAAGMTPVTTNIVQGNYLPTPPPFVAPDHTIVNPNPIPVPSTIQPYTDNAPSAPAPSAPAPSPPSSSNILNNVLSNLPDLSFGGFSSNEVYLGLAAIAITIIVFAMNRGK
jgi:hypothetical protein